MLWKPAHPKIRQLQKYGPPPPPPHPDRMLPLHPVTRAVGWGGGARFLFEERVVSSGDSEYCVMNGF